MANAFELKTPLEWLYQWETTKPDAVYLRQPVNGTQVDYTWGQAADQARRMATYLKSLDLPPGSHIGLWSKNCAHWVMADLAIMMSGHVSVPLYPTLTPETVNYTLTHGDVRMLFVGKLDGWDKMKSGIPDGMPCISFPYGTTDAYEDWNDVIAKNEPTQENPSRDMNELATIIYTSGSTGKPKGVMHNFLSFASLPANMGLVLPREGDEVFFSFLPMSHVAERAMVEANSLYYGARICFAESLDTFAQNIKETAPTHFLGIPRIIAKFQEGVFQKLPPKRLDLMLSIPGLSWFIRRKVVKTLGLQRCRVFGIGSAPTPQPLIEWYMKLGLNVLEGYAMTENFMHCHLNFPGRARLGTVGQTFPGVEARIGENGEIQMKSDCVMEGYYKEPEKTRDAFADGFLRTGDKGEIDPDGYLKITGRLKDLFKTAKGKYVAPAPIEMRIESDHNIEMVCLLGPGLPQPIALVHLSEIGQKLPRESMTEEVRNLIAAINPTLDKHERVEKVVIMKDAWTLENKVMTPTLKIKRDVVESMYADRQDAWYEAKDPVIWQS